jgi:hypothetical protein
MGKTMKAAIANLLNHYRVATRLREFGPYFLLELVMPGGSVIALLLWWHRHCHDDGRHHVLIRNGEGKSQ